VSAADISAALGVDGAVVGVALALGEVVGSAFNPSVTARPALVAEGLGAGAGATEAPALGLAEGVAPALGEAAGAVGRAPVGASASTGRK
jgi:hypothetical protein